MVTTASAATATNDTTNFFTRSSPVSELGAVAQRPLDVLLRPVVAQDVLIRAADDLVRVLAAPVAAAALVLQVAEAVAALAAFDVDPHRRDAIVPALAPQIADVAAESRRVAAEPRVAEHGDLGTAEDP